MSNYTPIVAYGPKDSLTHGDPNKALKGVQIDAELAAIASSLSTKVDSPMVAISVLGQSNVPAATFTGIGAPGTNDGVLINGGVSSADYALSVKSWNGALSYLLIRGDGHLLAGAFDFTPSSGSFSSTLTGAAAGTGNFIYYKYGNMVTIVANNTITGNTGGSGTNLLINASGMPTEIRANSLNNSMFVPFIAASGRAQIHNDGTFSFGWGNSAPANQGFQWVAGMIIFQYLMGF